MMQVLNNHRPRSLMQIEIDYTSGVGDRSGLDKGGRQYKKRMCGIFNNMGEGS